MSGCCGPGNAENPVQYTVIQFSWPTGQLWSKYINNPEHSLCYYDHGHSAGHAASLRDVTSGDTGSGLDSHVCVHVCICVCALCPMPQASVACAPSPLPNLWWIVVFGVRKWERDESDWKKERLNKCPSDQVIRSDAGRFLPFLLPSTIVPVHPLPWANLLQPPHMQTRCCSASLIDFIG